MASAWHTFDAALSAVVSIPLDKLTYYETAGHLYILATSRTKEHFRLIKIAKDDSRLNSFVDHSVYTAEEMDEIISLLLSNKPVLSSGKARAILGFVRFTKGYHIILAVRRKQVGRIGPHRVYEVRDTAMISLCEPETKGVLSRKQEEEQYRDMFRTFELKRYFYYSHSYDLSNTLQFNMTSRHAHRQVRRKFVWNEQLLEPMLATGGVLDSSQCFEDPLAPTAPNTEDFGSWAPWVVRLIHGCFMQAPMEIGSRSYTLMLLGRSSTQFAGARYLKRGINDLGYVANHVEVEQVVVNMGSLASYETRGRFASFVQVRGSVPVRWSHPMVNRPKPPISLHGSDVEFEATKLHFQELMRDYGAPIVILNLLKAREGKTSREAVLTNEYLKAVRAITSAMDPDDRKIQYVAYDLRNGAHRAWNNMMSIAEQHVDNVGFFACDERQVKLQCGVARSNCVDCIDRTNLGQFFVGLNTMAHMLVSVGMLRNPTELALHTDVTKLLLNMYLGLGDAIAIQYGGSPQVGAGVLDRGIGWDKLMGIQRLYNNFVVDKDKQALTNLFLRLYEPCPNHERRDREMQFPVYNQSENAIGNFFRFSGKKELPPVDPRRVADLGTLDSDYYLHVPRAPVLRRDFSHRWWEEALHHFMSLCDLTAISHCRARAMTCNVATMCSDGVLRQVSAHELACSQHDCWYTWRNKSIVDSESDDEPEQPLGNVYLEHTMAISNIGADDSHRAPWLERYRSPLSPAVAMCLQHLQIQSDDVLMTLPKRYLPGAGEEEPYTLCEDAAGAVHSYFPSEDAVEEVFHDHHAYPFEVANSVHAHALRDLAHFEFVPVSKHESALISLLIPLGDPREWLYEDVIRAMRVLNMDGSLDRAIYAIAQTQLSMAGLLRMRREVLEKTFDTKDFASSRVVETEYSYPVITSGEQRPTIAQAIRSFVERVMRDYPFMDEAALNAYLMSEEGAMDEDYEQPTGSMSFAQNICDALEPLVVGGLRPSVLEDSFRFWLGCMLDREHGIELTTKVRFVEGGSSTLPQHVILYDVVFASDIKRFVVKNSARMGLKIHMQRTDATKREAATAFLRIFVIGGLLRCVDVQVEANQRGIVALLSRPEDMEDNQRLFSFLHAERCAVLNKTSADTSATHFRSPGAFGVGDRSVSPQPFELPHFSPHAASIEVDSALHALKMGEAFASFCFAHLRTYIDDLSGSSTGSQSTDSTQMILENLQDMLSNLCHVDVTLLSQVARKCFFINIFNCLYIHAWIYAATQDSLTSFVTMYQTHGYQIGGAFFTLADIKHGILRRNSCAPRMILPPFSRFDPRLPLILDAEEGNYRMLFALVDAYLSPDNLHEVTISAVETTECENGSVVHVTYSKEGQPHQKLVSGNSFAMQMSGSTSVAPQPSLMAMPATVLMAAAHAVASGFSSATSPMTGPQALLPAAAFGRYGSEQSAPPAIAAIESPHRGTPAGAAAGPSPRSTDFSEYDIIDSLSASEADDDAAASGRKLLRTPSSPTGGGRPPLIGGKSNLLDWFKGGRNKSATFTHYCEPLFPATVEQKLLDIETSFLMLLQDQAAPSFSTNSGGPYPKLCQAFIGLDEFGRNPAEVMRAMQKFWRLTRRKYALLATTAPSDRDPSMLSRAASLSSILLASPRGSKGSRQAW